MAEFTPTTWNNDAAPDITAEQLNRMEAGILDAVTHHKEYETPGDMPAASAANRNWLAHVNSTGISYINFDGATWTPITAAPSLDNGEKVVWKADGRVIGELWVEDTSDAVQKRVEMKVRLITDIAIEQTFTLASLAPEPPPGFYFENFGDTNGIFRAYGTNFDTQAWKNPITAGRLVASVTSTQAGWPGPEATVDHNGATIWHSGDQDYSFIQYDLGLGMRALPNYYTYQSRYDTAGWYPHDVYLYGSNDGVTWDEIHHEPNPNVGTSGGASEWFGWVPNTTQAYRHFRFMQYRNSVNNGFMALTAFELYGLLIDTREDTPAATLTLTAPGDDNGVFYHLGTKGRARAFVNPVTGFEEALLTVAPGPHADAAYNPVNLTDRNQVTEGATADAGTGPAPALVYDLRRTLIPSALTFRTSNYPGSGPSDLIVDGSNDGSDWTQLAAASSLGGLAAGSWITVPISGSTPYRFIRVKSTVREDYYAILGGSELELYGDLSAPL